MYKIVLLVFILMGCSLFSFAQQKGDSVSIQNKNVTVPLDSGKISTAPTAAVDTTPFMTPKKIALLSAIIPGLGQYENKNYWKIPVIYVGIGVAVYFIYDNQKNYNDIRTEQAARLSNKVTTGKYSNPAYDANALTSLSNYYQQNLNLTYVLTGVGYALQVIDAVVFAHLKGFDISEDITLKWKPIVTPQGGPGFGLAMKF